MAWNNATLRAEIAREFEALCGSMRWALAARLAAVHARVNARETPARAAARARLRREPARLAAHLDAERERYRLSPEGVRAAARRARKLAAYAIAEAA